MSSPAGKLVTCVIQHVPYRLWPTIFYALSHIYHKINIIFTISMLQATVNHYNSKVNLHISKFTKLQF